MAQSSFPFENIDTTETQYSQLFRTLNNGVNGTPDGGELEVGPGSAGLTVDVAAGQSMVRGHFYSSTEVETRTLAVADSSNDRIDLIVLRLDPIANSIVLAVKTGTPDPAPVAPALVQTDGGVFEQPLANVLVPANAGVPSTITDRREFMGTKLGTWTTDGRPVPAGRVLFGFNTTLEAVEFYDPINEVWGPVAPEINSLDDIGDVTITTPADGELLAYDDGDWVNQALTAAQLPTGSILQVVSTIKTDIFSASVAQGAETEITGLTVSITPSSTNSKVLISYSISNSTTLENGANQAVSIFRGATKIAQADAAGTRQRVNSGSTSAFGFGNVAFTFLDSPSTTSATTYSLKLSHMHGGAQTVLLNRVSSAFGGDGDATNQVRGASAITVMEVAG